MPRLTSHASDLLCELQGARSVLRLVGGRVDPALLDALARAGDPMAVPALFRFMIGSDPATVQRVGAVITHLIAPVAVADLPDLDDACRSLGSHDVVDWTAWRDLTPADIRVLAASLATNGAYVLGVSSFHRSGYVRQAAVEELDTLETGAELPYLILRLNDWVSPVAETARLAVIRRIAPPWAPAWIASLPLLTWIRGTTRRSHGDVIERVFAFLREDAQRDALRAALAAPDRVVRRLAHSLARGSPAFATATVVGLALNDSDPLIRVDAIRESLPSLDDGTFRELLADIDANPFMPVRRAGLLAAAERFPDLAIGRAERALLDRHAAVREVARFQLRQLAPHIALAERYRAELSRARTVARVVAALAGIGETGDASDVAVLDPYLGHERALVRQTAIRALARVDAHARGSAFLRALSDTSPRVVREAQLALFPNSGLIDTDVLRQTMHTAPTLRGRIAALALSQSLGKWRNLGLLLEGSMLPELDVAEHARQLLRMWAMRVNRSSVPPRASELAELDELLSRTRFSIDDSIRREISATLDAWR